jgi:hypothetical protein
MQLFAILIMLVALFFLYRIAFPKRENGQEDRDIPPSEPPKACPDVMGKSRYVRPEQSRLLPTAATLPEIEKEMSKPDIFAPETDEKPSAVIPAGQLDEVFGNDTDNDMMSLSLEAIPENDEDEDEDEDEEKEIDWEVEEEAEERNHLSGYEPEYAVGMDYDDLQSVAKVVREQPDEVSEETGKTLVTLEHTDMFEWLVSGDAGKANWIKAVIERNIRKTMPDREKTEDENSDTDYGDFLAEFLS